MILTKKLGNQASSSAANNEIAMKQLSIDEELTAGHNKCCISEEEIARRRMLRRKFYGSSSDEEDEEVKEEVKEEEKKEQEWTLERMKMYYDADMHDHSKCKEAEKRRQRQSGFYYELAVKNNFLIDRFVSGQVSFPIDF